MFLAEVDKSRQLLKITIANHIEPADAKACFESLQSLLAEMQPGFQLLTDLSGVKSMPTSTAPYIGQIMELCTRRGSNWLSESFPQKLATTSVWRS